MNIENEDEFYYPAYEGGNFTEQYKRGFHTAHTFLKNLGTPAVGLITKAEQASSESSRVCLTVPAACHRSSN